MSTSQIDVEVEHRDARQELLDAAELGYTGAMLEALAERYRRACEAWDAARAALGR